MLPYIGDMHRATPFNVGPVNRNVRAPRAAPPPGYAPFRTVISCLPINPPSVGIIPSMSVIQLKLKDNHIHPNAHPKVRQILKELQGDEQTMTCHVCWNDALFSLPCSFSTAESFCNACGLYVCIYPKCEYSGGAIQELHLHVTRQRH